MSELFPKDIDAIARAAFETHLPGQFWDEKGEDVKSKWRDQVEPAIAGRNQTGGIPAIEAGIVKAWENYVATAYPSLPKPSDLAGIEPLTAEKFEETVKKLKPKVR